MIELGGVPLILREGALIRGAGRVDAYWDPFHLGEYGAHHPVATTDKGVPGPSGFGSARIQGLNRTICLRSRMSATLYAKTC